MLQRKITISKTKFGQKCLRGRHDATRQQSKIFGNTALSGPALPRECSADSSGQIVCLNQCSLGPALLKGLLYAFLVWLAHAFIVLPWIGEGTPSSEFLSAAGMF